MAVRIKGDGSLSGSVTVPGDKAISHRVALFGALADGTSFASNWLYSRATKSTLSCLAQMGVRTIVQQVDEECTVSVDGVGLAGLMAPTSELQCNRSATTMRLLMGILAGAAYPSVITGDAVLNARPMERIARPLRLMGADIATTSSGGPIRIKGTSLRPIEYDAPVASAHLHTAVILAAMHTLGHTIVRQPGEARDHSIRLLHAMGAQAWLEGTAVHYMGDDRPLKPIAMTVPGDMSTAAYWIVAASIVPGSDVRLLGVGVNPTRTGIIDVLQEMGADITLDNPRYAGGEPVADISVRATELIGTRVSGSMSLRMIDDFPALAVAALHARGRTVVTDAAELRVKDSDRIQAIARQLRALGAEVVEHDEGFEILGPQQLHGATVSSERDHRIGLALCVAALTAHGTTTLLDPEELTESYPAFLKTIRTLGAEVDTDAGSLDPAL